MTATRIRYIKTNEPDVLESQRTFYINGKSYKVRMNTKEVSYVIFDTDGDVIAASATRLTLHMLKKAIRESLAELGFPFTHETRARKIKE